MLQVNSGDKVTLEVFARYTTSTAGNNTIINNLVTAVTGVFGIVNAGETQTAYQALNNNLPGTSALIPTTTNVPKAYLYYIIFNSSYVYQQFGYFSVPLEAALGHVPLKLEVNVPVNGFLYTYVANESNVSSATSVFFDDFTIIHEKSTYSLRVVESVDYDPFGVVLEGTHYVDISRPLNSYLYQGEFAEFEKLTGWSRFAGRGNYDAVLGRWSSSDPKSFLRPDHSPFMAMGNNPVINVDPDGEFFWAALPLAAKTAIGIGAAIGAYSGYQIAEDRGASGFWEWAGYIGGGALIGGISGYAGYSMSILSIPFANTASMAGASTIYSGGMNLLSNGMTDFSTSFGAFSVNWSTGDFGYLGKGNNSGFENLGYLVGGFANASDIYGFAKGAFGKNADDIDLVTKNDPIGHSELRKDGKNVISVGPDQRLYVEGDSFWNAPGTNNWPTHAYDKDITVTSIKLTNVRLNKINRYVTDELSSFRYQALKFNCVTACSNALLKAGVLNLSFLRHPSLLQLQMFMRQNAYYTSFINYR
jgi:RHS repeat-associated protein